MLKAVVKDVSGFKKGMGIQLYDDEYNQEAPDPDPWSTLVYATRGTDVRMTMVDGRVLVRDYRLLNQDVAAITAEARTAASALAARARLR